MCNVLIDSSLVDLDAWLLSRSKEWGPNFYEYYKETFSMIDSQVLYLGRWVSREHFRAFVFNSTGQKLANSYDEYSKLIESGVWFPEKRFVNESNNIVQLTKKRGRKCQSQLKA